MTFVKISTKKEYSNIFYQKFTRTNERIDLYEKFDTNECTEKNCMKYLNIFEYSYGFYTLTYLRMNLQIYSYKQIWHKQMCSLNVIVIVNVNCGQVMPPHNSDQMSQRSNVSGIALLGCSLNVFVIVIVFVIVTVFVFVIVFLLVRSCLLITLVKCLKGHRSQGSLFVSQK